MAEIKTALLADEHGKVIAEGVETDGQLAFEPVWVR